MPIIEVPISDSQAQKFFESFQTFQEQLAKNPGLWRKTNEAILGQREAFRQLGHSARPVENLWRNVAGWSGTVLSTTLRITGELLKWGTLLGTGLLGGSLFGITRMASDVSNYRQRAMGLGMSIGGMRSFDVNFARLGNPGSFLSAINQAISNPALQSPLYALGVNPTGSTSQVSVAMLKAMRQLAKSTPRGELGLMSESYGLGPFGGLEKLMILKAMGNKEFASLLAGNTADKGPLGISKQTSLAWQKFTTQMELAGGEIFTVFVRGLGPLAGPLTRLSRSVVNLAERVMKKDGPLSKGIDQLAKWIDTFNGKISTPKFLKDVDKFMVSVSALADWAMGLSIKVGAAKNVLTHPGEDVKMAGQYYGSLISHGFQAGMHGLARATHLGMRYNNPGNLKFAGQAGAVAMPGGWAAFPTMSSGIAAMARQLGLDYRRGDNTIASIVGHYDTSPGDNVKAYVADVAQRMGVGAGARLNLNNPTMLAALMNAMIRHEQGYSPFRIQGAGRVVASAADPHVSVTVRSKTGASAVLAGAGLAAVPGT
ncbi:MAG: hypothetical protein WBW93_14425 [Steroidobacteraceae bacterium]